MTSVKALSVFFMAFFLAGASRLEAGSGRSSIQRADEVYKQGDYDEARKLYESAVRAYPDSPELEYNLGNAYFKLKKIGRAILHYERARRFEPHDYEINENLAYARGLIEYKLEDKRNWYWIQWSRILDLFSWTEWILLSLLLYTLLLGILILRFSLKRELKFFSLSRPLAFLFFLSLFPLGSKYLEEGVYHDAVVIAPKAEVRYGPSPSDKVAFRLVEGLEVRVEEVRGEWYLVGLVNGASGWCEKKNLEVI